MKTVKDVMNLDIPTIAPHSKVSDAAKVITDDADGCAVVVDGDFPLGIITNHDIVKNIDPKNKIMKSSVEKVMSTPLALLESSTKLDKALKITDAKKFRVYPVVDGRKLVGITTRNAIVHAASDNLKFHRKMQNTVLAAFVLLEIIVIFANVI